MSFRIDGVSNQQADVRAAKAQPKVDRAFSTFMNEALQTQPANEELKFSKHAQKRLEERGFHLGLEDISSLENAVNELDQKGAKNSLIVYKDMALIASINNRTIITALNTNEMETVTNIDSAIMVNK